MEIYDIDCILPNLTGKPNRSASMIVLASKKYTRTQMQSEEGDCTNTHQIISLEPVKCLKAEIDTCTINFTAIQK